jgi:hypothetical protein
VKSSTTFSRNNNIKNKRRNTTLLEQIKEERPHCWNRSKKKDHIVGTDQRRKTTLLEQIKEGRSHCWNRSKKKDHIVGTDQRRKTTLLKQIKEGTPHCWSRSNIKYSNRRNSQNKYP